MASKSEIQQRIEQARVDGGKHLYLGLMRLEAVPDEVWSLRNLESLDLAGNSFRTIPARLSELPKLSRIDIRVNPIEHLPEIRGLVIDEAIYQRVRGDIDPLNIVGITIEGTTDTQDTNYWLNELRKMRNLRELWVSGGADSITTLLNSVGELTSLEKLGIGGSEMPSLPASIQRLSGLKSLYLDGLGMRELPEWLGHLPLESFGAPRNDLTNAALEGPLRKLKNLTDLGLSSNPLENIPDAVFDLPKLESLILMSCGIREVPDRILKLHRLKYLFLYENPIETPPAEVVNRGLDAIRDYWRQRESSGVDYLCEAKLIILGEAGAGKTSLARKIENPRFKLREREPSTEGIDVIRYRFQRRFARKTRRRRNFSSAIFTSTSGISAGRRSIMRRTSSF
jgi:internalin A